MRLEYNPKGRIPALRLVEGLALIGLLIALLLYLGATGNTWMLWVSPSPSVEFTLGALYAVGLCLYLLWRRGSPLIRELSCRFSSPQTDAVTVVQIVADRKMVQDGTPGFGQPHSELSPWAEYLFWVEFPDGHRRICQLEDKFLREFRVGDVALMTRHGGWIVTMEPFARRENLSRDETAI